MLLTMMTLCLTIRQSRFGDTIYLLHDAEQTMMILRPTATYPRRTCCAPKTVQVWEDQNADGFGHEGITKQRFAWLCFLPALVKKILMNHMCLCYKGGKELPQEEDSSLTESAPRISLSPSVGSLPVSSSSVTEQTFTRKISPSMDSVAVFELQVLN